MQTYTRLKVRRLKLFSDTWLSFAAIALVPVFAPISIADDNSAFKLPEGKPYSQQLQNYRDRFSRVTGLEASALHWGKGVVIYLNKGTDVYKTNHLGYLKEFNRDGDEDLQEGPGIRYKKYPVGTIIVKEQFNVDQNHFIDGNAVPKIPEQISIMIKREQGYDANLGDWQFVQLAPNGTVIVDGSSKDPAVHGLCGGCHLNMASRDYIFSTFYSGRQP